MKKIASRIVLAFGVAAAAVSPHAMAAPTAQINSGYTLVEFLPGFVDALVSQAITPSKNLPGTLYQRIGFFPIVGGRLDLANAKAEIPHSGGVTLTKGSTKVVLSDFVVETTGPQPRLTGIVTADGDYVARIPLFNLALPTLTLPLVVPPGPETLLIEGSLMTLTPEAATALNGVFATGAFTAGFNVGIASVYANY